jgi:hypothetical protein
VAIAKIDGPSWRSLTFRFGVNGFPSFFHIHNGGGPRQVRKLGVAQSTEAVVEAATSGWRDLPAMPLSASPFGPFALVKYHGLYWAEKVFKLHEPISTALDIPPVIMQFTLGMVLLVAFTGGLMGFAAWLGPRRRAHDD